MNRSHRRYREVRAAILAASDICWLCNEPGADEVDHVLELSKGGSLLDPTNLRPAHGRKRLNPDGSVRCPGNRGRSNRKVTTWTW